MEAGQLKLALGSALLPVAEDLMPDVIIGFQSIIESIHDNKDGIEELASVVALGFDLAQGFYLARPEFALQELAPSQIEEINELKRTV